MLLNFDDGVQEYDLNGKCTIRINPTDFAFVDSLFSAFTELDKKEAEWREKTSQIDEPKEILGLFAEMDKYAREKLNGLFGEDICTPIFGTVNVLSFGNNGLSIWMNFVFAIIDVMDSSYVKAKKEHSPNLNKYLQKYHR